MLALEYRDKVQMRFLKMWTRNNLKDKTDGGKQSSESFSYQNCPYSYDQLIIKGKRD